MTVSENFLEAREYASRGVLIIESSMFTSAELASMSKLHGHEFIHIDLADHPDEHSVARLLASRYSSDLPDWLTDNDILSFEGIAEFSDMLFPYMSSDNPILIVIDQTHVPSWPHAADLAAGLGGIQLELARIYGAMIEGKVSKHKIMIFWIVPRKTPNFKSLNIKLFGGGLLVQPVEAFLWEH